MCFGMTDNGADVSVSFIKVYNCEYKKIARTSKQKNLSCTIFGILSDLNTMTKSFPEKRLDTHMDT